MALTVIEYKRQQDVMLNGMSFHDYCFVRLTPEQGILLVYDDVKSALATKSYGEILFHS